MDDSQAKPGPRTATAAGTLDRFGFPIEWAIDFRRAGHQFRKVSSALDPEDTMGLAAARLLLDGDVPRAVKMLSELESSSFRDLFNLAVAHEHLGDERDANRLFAAALAADEERFLELRGSRDMRKVNFILPFPVTTGGMRVQLDLAASLARSGFEVTVIQVRGEDARTMPGTDVFRRVVSVAGHDQLTSELRRSPSAFTIAGCWIDYLPALRAGNTQVVGFSGGEPTLNEDNGFDDDFLAYRLGAHRLPVRLLTCSRFIQDVYRHTFGRASDYIPAPLDERAFRDATPRPDRPFRVLLVARDGIKDKGLSFAIPALLNLRRRGLDIEIVWVTPQAPELFVDLECELHVNPPKSRLFDIFRTCHALVYPPLIDGLGLPPLEAMAAGVAVVLTESGGSSEFAHHERNCIVVEKGSVAAIEHAVEHLYHHPETVRTLIAGGRQEAVRYRPSNSAAAFERYLGQDHLTVCTDLP